ncbi:hypothetical protein OSTOST_15606 [Ostertagia ostertagi]
MGRVSQGSGQQGRSKTDSRMMLFNNLQTSIHHGNGGTTWKNSTISQDLLMVRQLFPSTNIFILLSHRHYSMLTTKSSTMDDKQLWDLACYYYALIDWQKRLQVRDTPKNKITEENYTAILH